MEVWGTTPASRSFLCHTPPRALSTVLVEGHGPPAAPPRLIERDQVPPQASDLGRQASGSALRRRSNVRREGNYPLEQRAQRAHLGGRLGEHGEQLGCTVCRWRTIMITKALRKSRSVYTRGQPGLRFSGAWGVGRRSTSSTRVTSKPCWPIIAATSTCVVLVW